MALLRLGPLTVPTPGEVADAAGAVSSWVGEVVVLGAALPNRVDTLIDEVTRLLAVLSALAERADGLVGRAEGIVGDIEGVIATSRTITDGAQEVVESSRAITAGANEVVESSRAITTGANEVVESSRTITTGASELLEGAGETSRSAQELLALYQPMLSRGAPLAGRFIEELSQDEVESAIKLVDQVPRLTEHMVTDIMPILETFDRVGPDLHELLDVTKDMRQAIAGIPGLGYLVKRGASKDARDEDD